MRSSKPVLVTFSISAWEYDTPRLYHLVFFGQVDPQLKAPQVALCDFGHFTVNNAPPSCHPLYTSRTNHSL